MRNGGLRWFVHVQRKYANNVTRRVTDPTLPGTRRRGRSKKILHQHMKDSMMGAGVTQAKALVQKEWIRRTRAPPRIFGQRHQGEQGEQPYVLTL